MAIGELERAILDAQRYGDSERARDIINRATDRVMQTLDQRHAQRRHAALDAAEAPDAQTD